MTVLVTGGAGYIGAHVVRLLEQRGERVVVVDDLSSGSPERVGGADLVRLDLTAPEAPASLIEVFEADDVSAVIHFAAKKQVAESVAHPIWYYRQNLGGLATVLEAMSAAGVGRLVFSSSAAVYGNTSDALVSEDDATVPTNPYGETKLYGEAMARAAAAAGGPAFIGLRYFNVAGAGWDDLGDPGANNLIPMVFDRIEAGERPIVFGTDYPTVDGTCVRDFVHVLDLAEAHLAALDHLDRPVEEDVFNIGTGAGYSVLDVIGTASQVAGVDGSWEAAPRRAGDPAVVVASPERAHRLLGWHASRGLHGMVASAYSARHR